MMRVTCARNASTALKSGTCHVILYHCVCEGQRVSAWCARVLSDVVRVQCPRYKTMISFKLQVAIGVGALAGSTVMLLTLPWFLAVFSGRVSITPENTPTYKRPANADINWDKLQPPGSMNIFSTGVGVGKAVRDNSKVGAGFHFRVSDILFSVPFLSAESAKGGGQVGMER